MSPVPSDDAGWRQLIRTGQPAFGHAMVAVAPGAEIYERGGVVAEIFPSAPERSVFNSVFYRGAQALIERLDELAALYRKAGVRAWTVWVPEDDTEVARALEAAGHKLDAKPRDMAIALSELREPELDPELAVREEYDLGTMARINEVAYGWLKGDFNPVAEAPMPDLRVYFADLGGGPVSTLALWLHDSDALVAWVATLPEARGRGLSTRLLARALLDAREQGIETSTLQATELGYPVYAKLGYRDCGAVQMWERRDAD
jgi:GNAT superfamily N-acetyltransferase